MDSATEKSCLEDISSLVFDSLQKVTLKTISNNYEVTNAVAKDILDKWLTKNEKKLKELVKEFIIQGINKKGIFTISVVSEKNKEILAKKWKNFDSWLYSVETKSNSRPLNLPPKYEPINVKNVTISLGNRDLDVPIKQEPTTSKVDTTKIKTPFGMVKPLDKKDIKKEPTEKPIKEEPVKIIDPKKEELPPKISPESKNNTSKAGTNKKNAKPAASGKASISSFFNKPGSKPASSTDGKKEAPVKPAEIVNIEPKSTPVPVKEEPSLKRPASPEKKKPESTKKPVAKKPKLKDPPNKKRSRIQVMEDSSEEEEEEPQIDEQPDSKFIKFDREMTPERKTPSPAKVVSEDEEMTEKPKDDVQKKAKNKAKRWVTKRFETDDGFIRTEKVLEEYSASEDEHENDENRKKNSPPQEKQTTSPTMKKTPQKKVTAKTKVKDMPKSTKQGSIMSFFAKK